MVMKTEKEVMKWIEANQTKAGGYTKKFLMTIGVSWPPQKGWKKRVAKDYLSDPYKFLLVDLQRQYK